MSELASALDAVEGQEESDTAQSHRMVWDLPVRVAHWLLVAAFVGAYVTNALGVNYFRYHVWCGYAVIVLVLFRIVWGLVGTRHARFEAFVRGPRETLRYARSLLRGSEQRHAGHNPLGAWMVLALLLMMLTQAVTGLFGDDQVFNLGPLYGYVTAETSSILTSLHRRLFYWIAAAVGLHILAVLMHVFVKRENLVLPMITGRKPADRVGASEAISTSRVWLAALLIGLFAAALAWTVLMAPRAVRGSVVRLISHRQ